MKVIKQNGYPDLEIDNREPDIIMVWQKFTERNSDVNQITREKAREYAISICPELAEEIERLKANKNKDTDIEIPELPKFPHDSEVNKTKINEKIQ